MLADFDYFINSGYDKYGILDCKSGNSATRYIWDNDSIPLDYEYQGYHYDIIADGDIDRIYFAALLDNTMESLIKRELDSKKIDYEQLIVEEKTFWDAYVDKKIPPPLKEENPDKILEHMISYLGYEREDNTPPIELPECFAPIIEKHNTLKAEKQEYDRKVCELDKDIGILKAQLCDAMGKDKNAICVSSTGTTYEIKNNYSDTFHLDKTAQETMRIVMPNTF